MSLVCSRMTFNVSAPPVSPPSGGGFLELPPQPPASIAVAATIAIATFVAVEIGPRIAPSWSLRRTALESQHLRPREREFDLPAEARAQLVAELRGEDGVLGDVGMIGAGVLV